MARHIPNFGSVQRPFPREKPSQALQAEDAFMHAHGGPGPRTLFALANILPCPLRIRPRNGQTSQWRIKPL